MCHQELSLIHLPPVITVHFTAKLRKRSVPFICFPYSHYPVTKILLHLPQNCFHCWLLNPVAMSLSSRWAVAAFLFWRVGSHCGGFSCCGARALGHWASCIVARGLVSHSAWLVALRHVGSSWIKDQPAFPALTGSFFITELPGKPYFFLKTSLVSVPYCPVALLASASVLFSLFLFLCLTLECCFLLSPWHIFCRI